MKNFGRVLRQKRQEAGLSQRQLAEQAAVDFSYISKLENHRLPAPAVETIYRFAEALRCAPEELLAAARKMPPEFDEALAQPAALRFLQHACRLRLSDVEWESLISTLQHLR